MQRDMQTRRMGTRDMETPDMGERSAPTFGQQGPAMTSIKPPRTDYPSTLPIDFTAASTRLASSSQNLAKSGWSM